MCSCRRGCVCGSRGSQGRRCSRSASSWWPMSADRMSIDFSAVDALTFDCYGTLIDWERGILAALRPVCEAHGVRPEDRDLLEAHARHEAALEAGPYMAYREVLAGAVRGVGGD